ncbi:MAG: ABC transporter ATP-binding protein [Alphaproteobacteria bacterium]|nr:ABC transporter ATP-binding protein [Alphaproteobacteria bacterium]
MPGLAAALRQGGPIALDARIDCAAGEILALVGPSGSGKTTILRAIAGTYRPQHGRIAVGGETWLDDSSGICLPAHRRRVGIVFQSYALFPHMTAQENVAAAMGHLPRAERPARAARLLDMVHLSGLEARRPSALSGGQQQRVAVARALARDPALLLLDEPFAAVDKATRQRLYREIVELRRTLRMPVVLVTHDLDEASMLADRIAVLHRGRTLQAGTPQEVTRRPVSPDVARLVDLHNLFEATLAEHRPAAGRSLIEWNGQRLEVAHAPGFAVGCRVAWAVPSGFVVLHRRDRPSRGDRENPVAGTIETMLAIGEMAQLSLRPHGQALPIRFAVPMHVAERNGLAPGVEAAVSLLAEGIHLMAPSDGAAR